MWLQLFSEETFDSSHCVSSWWKETFQMWILWLQIFIFLFTVLRNLFSVIFVTFKQTQNVIFCWKLWQHLLVKYFHLPENLVPSCLFFLGIINLDTGSYFCLKIWCNVASFFLGIRNLDIGSYFCIKICQSQKNWVQKKGQNAMLSFDKS